MKLLSVHAGLVLAGLMLPGLALAAPATAPKDARIRTIRFVPDQTLTINTGQGISTLVMLGDDEAIETMAVGDSQSWSLARTKAGNAVMIKPLIANAEANLNIVSNRHVYSLLLVSSDNPEHRPSFQVRFSYPDDPSGTLMKDAERSAAAPSIKNIDRNNLNYAYEYRGTARLKPRVAFDDGTKTFIEPVSEVPAIFLVNADGTETLVNFRKEDRFLVIDKVAAQFTLRAGNETLCLFNRKQYGGNDPIEDQYGPRPAKNSWSLF